MTSALNKGAHTICLKSISHKTRLGTRFPYGILGYTRVNWYEFLASTVLWYELDSDVARVCTNKARIYSVKQSLSRCDYDLHTTYIRLFNGSKFGLVRSCTVKYDFYSIFLTFTGLTYRNDRKKLKLFLII